MEDPWALILLGVFAVHLPLFAYRWRQTGERRYAATTLTFFLLVVAYGLRVLAPDLSWLGLPVHEALRRVAWLAAAVSLGLLAHHHLGRGRFSS